MTQWIHISSTAFAAFLASLVEFVEALTIVLAVGISRSWRSALLGAASGLLALVILVLAFSPLLTSNLFPLAWVQIVIGVLLLVFGFRWLRKAVLRAAAVIPLRDEAAVYQRQIKQMADADKLAKAFDVLSFVTSFKAVLIEGLEVVFIIIAVGTAEASFVPASLGAALALVLVLILGIALHKPLTRVPENKLKFGVGVILTAFGAFWLGEGSGLDWPGGDLAIPALIVGILAAALLVVSNLKKRLPIAY